MFNHTYNNFNAIVNNLTKGIEATNAVINHLFLFPSTCSLTLLNSVLGNAVLLLKPNVILSLNERLNFIFDISVEAHNYAARPELK